MQCEEYLGYRSYNCHSRFSYLLDNDQKPCQQCFLENERKINALSAFIQRKDAILQSTNTNNESKMHQRRGHMTIKSSLTKTTAITLAATFFASGILPLAQASAHDRRSAAAHGVYNQKWNKRIHRKFHNHYGRGNHGTRVYVERYGHRHHVKRKRSKKGDLIAAGVIGLALGAIIASEANKNKHRPAYNTYNRPAPQPTYQYDTYNQGYNNGQHIPLDNYNHRTSNPYVDRGGPEVITYRDTASLEPWTPGWRNWCANRYRSFNQQTGTFRGYDGLDHFCVPK
jgi:hypothetical protein